MLPLNEKKVVMDTLGLTRPEAFKRLQNLAVTDISLHVAIDSQSSSPDFSSLFRLIPEDNTIKTWVAGDIGIDNIVCVLTNNPDVIIAGSSINKQSAPKDSSKSAKGVNKLVISNLLPTVLTELESVLKQVGDNDINNIAQKIHTAPRIFVFGEGRSGLMGKTFAMR